MSAVPACDLREEQIKGKTATTPSCRHLSHSQGQVQGGASGRAGARAEGQPRYSHSHRWGQGLLPFPGPPLAFPRLSAGSDPVPVHDHRTCNAPVSPALPHRGCVGAGRRGPPTRDPMTGRSPNPKLPAPKRLTRSASPAFTRAIPATASTLPDKSRPRRSKRGAQYLENAWLRWGLADVAAAPDGDPWAFSGSDEESPGPGTSQRSAHGRSLGSSGRPPSGASWGPAKAGGRAERAAVPLRRWRADRDFYAFLAGVHPGSLAHAKKLETSEVAYDVTAHYWEQLSMTNPEAVLGIVKHRRRLRRGVGCAGGRVRGRIRPPKNGRRRSSHPRVQPPRMHWKGGRIPPPPLQGALRMPGHCPPDGKCRAQWHL